MKKNNFKSLMQAAVLICTPLVIASCDDVFGDVDNPVSSHISIKDAPVSLALHKDSVARATYTRTAIAASGAQIEYSSTKPEIATVDAKTGKITAVSGGDCEIIAKSTGLDSRGNKTYQEEEVRFPVKVIDYRARIALKEGATKEVFNSALVDATKPIDLTKLLDVLPAMGTTGLQIEYGTINPTTHAFTAFGAGHSDAVIQSISSDGKITLQPSSSYTFSTTPHHEFVKIAAHIKATPAAYEVTSFKDQQTTAEFTIDVREGIAYVTGYDADNKPIEGSMLYLDNDDEGTKPNYTILNTAWASALPAGDVYLKAGWYSLENSLTLSGRNIRVQGDANFVFASGKYLDLDDGKSLMDASTSKSYKLNILPAKGATYGGYSMLRKIQDFSDVNILMPKVSADLDKIGTANIAAGSFGTLQNIETLNFKSGSVNGMNKIGTANITAGSFYSHNWGTTADPLNAAFYDVTNLNIEEANIYGALNTIGTATISISGTIAYDVTNITTLNLKKGSISGNLSKIGTATINTAGGITGTYDGTTLNLKKGTINTTTVKVSSLVMDGGSVTTSAGFTGNITMNDGTLTANHTANDKYAVVGDVEVVKGTFKATNANYVAVNGKLTGSFVESSTGGTAASEWTAVSGNTSTAPYVKNVVPAP